MSTMNTYGDDALAWLISTCIAVVILLGSGALYMLIEYYYCKMKRRR